MDDFEEPAYGDEQEVRIEDLGAPEKGADLFLYRLGKHLRARFRARPTALILVTGLVFMLLLPGSTLMNSPTHIVRPTLAPSQQRPACSATAITINAQDITTWQRLPSTPISTGTATVYICSGSIQLIIFPGSSDSATPQP